MLSQFLEEELVPAIGERLLPVRCSPARVLVLDGASDSLAAKMRAIFPAAECLDRLPAPESEPVDLLVANLVLPWCDNLLGMLQGWRRVLRPGGIVMLTMLGPDTLQEWQGLHPPFVRMDMHNVGDALVQAGFQEPVLDVDVMMLAYRDREKCLLEMRAAGLVAEGNTVPVACDETGRLMLTVEIIYAHAFSPLKEQVKGEVRVPVTSILRS